MNQAGLLRAVNMGIDTHEEPIIYMRSDCHVCLAEGFTANTRLKVSAGAKSLIATLNIVTSDAPRPSAVTPGSVGFSISAWKYLDLTVGQLIEVRHAPVVRSLSSLRKKIYGHELSHSEINSIIGDISQQLYSDIEVAGFLTACAGKNMTTDEVIALTHAMITVGNRLRWVEYPKVFDKHCVGGLPGNRTTPIVIAIASAAGLRMPKTSSRAITSPAGTADTMAVLTNVELSQAQLVDVVKSAGACLAWGGRVMLSPTDDLLIRIERALDLDGEGQLVASVLSKKVAAGSTHILIDIPVGPTAKVRDNAQAERLAKLFYAVANALKVHLRCVITDGTQTIGYGIGPAEEAKDVLAVLQNQPYAPLDLAERSVLLAAHLLAMASGNELDVTLVQAKEILASGSAWRQFVKICDAQGGLKSIPDAAYQATLSSESDGIVIAVDNRRLAQVAKLAGAPTSPTSGLRLKVKVGDRVKAGQPLLVLSADTQGGLEYAADFYRENRDIFRIGEPS